MHYHLKEFNKVSDPGGAKAGLVATSGGFFLIAAVPAAACLGAPTSNPAAATAVTCAWGGAVPGDVAWLVTVVTVAERAVSLALRLAPLPGLYDALKGSAIPCVMVVGLVDRTPRAATRWFGDDRLGKIYLVTRLDQPC